MIQQFSLINIQFDIIYESLWWLIKWYNFFFRKNLKKKRERINYWNWLNDICWLNTKNNLDENVGKNISTIYKLKNILILYI